MSWLKNRTHVSMPEVYESIPVEGTYKKRLWAFVGPGLMVAVGYMDPGNWQTDLQGGAQFGYTLLSVIFLSNIFAIFLQHLALKLGIVSGRDLAQACHDHYSKPVNFVLWILCELAIIACDLAEVIGTAVALELLFGIPLAYGVGLTALDVFFILLLQNHGFQYLERFVAGLIFMIFGCFAYELWLASPDPIALAQGVIPSSALLQNTEMLYIAVGILGATVMPHNLYLHSSIVQTRKFAKTEEGKKEAITFATIDSTVSLMLALFVNASILILAAATFHGTEHQNIADIHDAYHLLSPLLGAKYAGIAFAVALLAAGQNSTITGTLAGQIVMEGFVNIKLKPWVRRLLTRALAIIPAAIVAILFGQHGVGSLLTLSQVILSLQLSFAIVPLVYFTSQKSKMGIFANSTSLAIVAWIISGIIISLNLWLLIQVFLT